MLIVGEHHYEIRNIGENMTDEEFFQFCLANRDLRIERDKDQNIIIMSPVEPESGYYEGIIFNHLFNWNEKAKSGITFGSSTGFKMPNGATRSPDACWISLENWKKLAESKEKGFPLLCPEFVVELRSRTDRLKTVKEKMAEWIENGVQLGWLIDPKEQKAYIYRADGSIEIVAGFDKQLSGEEVLKGFRFDLSKLKLP